MLNNRRMLNLATCLFTCTFMLFGCVSLKQVVEVAGDNRAQYPVRWLIISIERSQRRDLFVQLQKFADKHSFKYLTSDYGTGGESFMVQMSGNGITILAVDIPKAPTMVSIRFYDDRLENPTSDETIKTMDELVSDLKTLISEIPNVTITQKK